jgi:hypothetical protein
MPITPDQYKPTPDELGAIMRARTKDDVGNELGTFTPDTRPTKAEAESAIDDALALVAPRLGGSVADRLQNLARSTVLLRAAMTVETSYTPNDDNESGAYDRYEQQYKEALEAYDLAAGQDAGQDRRRVGTLRVKTYFSQPAP